MLSNFWRRLKAFFNPIEAEEAVLLRATITHLEARNRWLLDANRKLVEQLRTQQVKGLRKLAVVRKPPPAA